MTTTSSTNGLVDVDIDLVLQHSLYATQRAFWKTLEQRLQRVAPFKTVLWRNLEYKSYIQIILEGVFFDYFGSWYRGINQILRKDPNETETDHDSLIWFTQARIMSFMTRRGTTAPVDMTLYRGVFYNNEDSNPSEIDSKYQPGMAVEYNQILSTTNSVEVALTFSGKNWKEQGLRIIYIMQIPKGSPFHVKRLDRDVYNRKNEPEIIFPNCTRWVVDRREASNDNLGRIYVYMHLQAVGSTQPVTPGEPTDTEIATLASNVNDYVATRITFDNMFWESTVRPRLVAELHAYRKEAACISYTPMTVKDNPTPLQLKVRTEPAIAANPVNLTESSRPEAEQDHLSSTFENLSVNPASQAPILTQRLKKTKGTAKAIALSISEASESDIALVTRSASDKVEEYMTTFLKKDKTTKLSLAKKALESHPVDATDAEIKETMESAILATKPIQASAPIVPSDKHEEPRVQPNRFQPYVRKLNEVQHLFQPYVRKRYVRRRSSKPKRKSRKSKPKRRKTKPRRRNISKKSKIRSRKKK